MHRGKMSLATSLVYDALDMASDKTGRPAMDVLEQALKNVGPIMEVRPRRVGGATYQVPMEVPSSPPPGSGDALDHHCRQSPHGQIFF